MGFHQIVVNKEILGRSGEVDECNQRGSVKSRAISPHSLAEIPHSKQFSRFSGVISFVRNLLPECGFRHRCLYWLTHIARIARHFHLYIGIGLETALNFSIFTCRE
jgi:hypothetical protein